MQVFSQNILQTRNDILQAIRRFFLERDFIEVETPIRLPAPALEEFIDAIPSDDWYLRTSPELHMKRLLSDGIPRMFQMGACFRRGECGHLHNQEFTMLEWYRAHSDYREILSDTKLLIEYVAEKVLGGETIKFGEKEIDLNRPWLQLTVAEAFVKHAGWNPVEEYDADRFDFDLINKVEPALPKNRGVVLIDYPAEAAALSKRKADNPAVAERWELYLGGIEIANAFSELTDAEEQRERFEECAAKRAKAGRDVYPMDRPFLNALERGMPPSGGVALGVDRLVMFLANVQNIHQVRIYSNG